MNLFASKACFSASAWPWAFRALASLRHPTHSDGLAPTRATYNALFGCTGGAWSTVLDLAEQTRRVFGTLDQQGLTAALSACERFSTWHEALRLIQSDEREDLDVISFTAAIKICGSSLQWQFALHFLQKMSSMAVRPNCVTYGAVLSACEKASTTYSSHWTFALQLVVDASTQNLSSDIMFSTSISACEKSSQWQKAVLELETLKKNKRKLQAYSFNPVMAGCVSSSHWKNAWELYEKMPQLRLLPDSFTYTALMKTGASEGGTGATSGATLWQRELVLLKNAFVSQRESEEDRRQNQKGTKQERQVATVAVADEPSVKLLAAVVKKFFTEASSAWCQALLLAERVRRGRRGHLFTWPY